MAKLAGTKPSQDHEIGFLNQTLQQELIQDARDLAPALLSEVMPSTVHVPKREFLAYVRRNWSDPAFRQSLYQRIAPAGPLGQPRIESVKAFIHLVKDAFSDTSGDPGTLQLAKMGAARDDAVSLSSRQAVANVTIPNEPGHLGPGAGLPEAGPIGA